MGLSSGGCQGREIVKSRRERERESLELVLSGATVSGKSSPSKFNEIIA